MEEEIQDNQPSTEILPQLLAKNGGKSNKTLKTTALNASQIEEEAECDETKLKLAEELNYEVSEQVAYRNLGTDYWHSGQYEKAVESYQKSLEMAQESGNKNEERRLLQDIGVCLGKVGQTKKAIKYELKALKLTQELNDKVNEQVMFRTIGVHYENIGHHETAMIYYHKALNAAQELENKNNERIVLQDIGVCLEKVGQSREAINYDLKALKLTQELNDKINEQIMYYNLGRGYDSIGQHEAAMGCYLESLNMAKELGNKSNERIVLQDIGVCLEKVGRSKEAIGYDLKALKLTLQLEDKVNEQVMNRNLGNHYRNVGHHGKATECYNKALMIARELGVRSNEHLLCLDLAKSYRNIGQPTKALEYSMKAMRIAEVLNDKERNRTTLNTSKPPYNNNLETKETIALSVKPKEIRKGYDHDGRSEVKWTRASIKHQSKFEQLVKILKTEPSATTRIGIYRACFKPEFIIGKGYDGTRVYIGLSDDGIEVAVKSLPLDSCKELGLHEKEILNTPNVRKQQHIVNYRFYTEDVDSIHAYLVLDLCEQNLEDYVKDRGKDELKSDGPTVIRQMLLGLEALHCGKPVILHRDLKPSNILVNLEGEMVLADFGISRKLREGQTTYNSCERGSQGWIARESLPTDEDGDSLSDEEIRVRYKKESDIQVAGMVCFYILTKGDHPYGKKCYQTPNVIEGDPVYLDKLDDPVAKDLIKWMLQHDPEDRPSAQECLKHPYLLSKDEQFNLVTRVGNEPEIKTKDAKSVVVKELNADPSLTTSSWKSQIDVDVMSYVSGHRSYTNDLADLLRFIRNTSEHWYDKSPPTAVQKKVEKPKDYFLKLFPTLPVVLHRIIRNESNWNQREQLKQFFGTLGM